MGKGELRESSRRIRGIGGSFALYSTGQTDSSRCGQNFRDANEIVGGRGQHEEPFDQAASAMSGLAQAADRLHPAERLFDALALDRADALAGMAGCAGINCRTPVGIVLRDMRRAAALAAAGHEVGGVIVLVAAHRAARFGVVVDHVERDGAFGGAIGLGQSCIDDEPVAVLHHQVPHMAEFCFLAGTLAKQPRVRVGGRRMRVILAFLTMEVALGIAAAAAFSSWRFTLVLGHKTLHAGPGLDQRAVDRKMLARKQLAHLRQVQDDRHELGRDIAVEQPVAVLAEHGRIPHWVIRREADEPAKQRNSRL